MMKVNLVESDESSGREDSHAEDNSPDPLDSDTTARLSLSVGQWVLVRYDGLEFPGEVTSCTCTKIFCCLIA